MKAVLEARKAAKDVLTAAGLTVLFNDEAALPSGTYLVLTVISAPPLNDFSGERAALIRLQVDAWALATAGSTAALAAETARTVLEAAGWTRVPSGAPPLSWEGEKDAAGKRWWRASFDATREA